MANVKFSRKEFEKSVGKITEDIKEKIALFGTPPESLTDDEIEIEIFPNRPDLLSLQGYLRSFLSFLGKKKNIKYKINKPEKNYEVKINSNLKNIRPFTVCAVVKNLKFNDEKIKEIVDIQEKLHTTVGRNRRKVAIGIYPLEKITLPIEFKAESPDKIKFIPLESDKEMTGRQILSRHPAGRAYGYLLEKFKQFPVFRDSKGEVLSVPPIINSQLTGKINEKTKDVFIECSGFDFNTLNKTLNILVSTLSDLGGEVYSMKLNYGNKKIITPSFEKEKMKISIEDAEKLLGIELPESKIKNLVEKMGYTYDSKKKQVEIPAWRVDILHPVDVYEDIAIAYGYQNFNPEIPEISTIGGENFIEIKKRKISEILTGLGFLEVSSFHLTTKQDLRKAGLRIKSIEVEDSKTDFKILRPSLISQGLRILSENVDAKYPQKIFELGKIFEKKQEQKENSEGEIIEKHKLCILLCGETDFTEIKQTLEYLMKSLGLNKQFKIKEAQSQQFIDGRTAAIIIEKNREEKQIGIFGEIAPFALKNWHLKMPVSALEINIDELEI